ncbi:TPA: hypothetical protein O7M80_005126 [Escherichia coli]|nr:hypothetical protein [Escherichia coli]
MKTFIKTLLVAVTVLFSVVATADQIKLPDNIKYVNTTEEFSCTEIDGMNCQIKNHFRYKDIDYVFVLERGGAWCYDYTVSVLNLKTGKAQMIEYNDKQLCSGNNEPFFKAKNGNPTVGIHDTSEGKVVVAESALKI